MTGNQMPELSREQAEAVTDAEALALGIGYVPPSLQPRLRRLVAKLADQQNARLSKARRDALLRIHDQTFNDKEMSLTRRAKAIESDLRRAAAIDVPSSPRLVSAKVIIDTPPWHVLGYKQLMSIIQ